jgi:hypothetical protein
MDVCPFSCIALFNVILTAMCIYVIYKCLSWDLDQQKDLGKQAKNSQAKPSAWEVVQRLMSCGK